jgi:hypothetical protein
MAKQQGFPLTSYYGRHMKPKPIRTGLLTPITKKEDKKEEPKKEEPKKVAAPARKPLDDFEAEYQAFIAQLRAKKAAEEG